MSGNAKEKKIIFLRGFIREIKKRFPQKNLIFKLI